VEPFCRLCLSQSALELAVTRHVAALVYWLCRSPCLPPLRFGKLKILAANLCVISYAIGLVYNNNVIYLRYTREMGDIWL
jgi:hypothetical protein